MINWGQPQSRTKGYPDAQQIPLPDPRGYQGLSVEEAIEARRSQRALLAGCRRDTRRAGFHTCHRCGGYGKPPYKTLSPTGS